MSESVASGAVLATVRSAIGTLKPGERRVADVVLASPEWVIEATLADVAERAGVSGATVVRMAQHLGFRGFPHLRVLLARDVGAAGAAEAGAQGSSVRAWFEAVAASAQSMAALLDDDAVQRAVDLLAGAGLVLAAGNGVSAPVAADLAMRLSAIGRPAVAPSDNLDQMIQARLLRHGDVCVVVSGTGATRGSLRVARAAAAAGVPVISLSTFANSPLSEVATVELLVGQPGEGGMRAELHRTLRIPQTILVAALVDAVAKVLPETSVAAHARVLEVVADELDD